MGIIFAGLTVSIDRADQIVTGLAMVIIWVMAHHGFLALVLSVAETGYRHHRNANSVAVGNPILGPALFKQHWLAGTASYILVPVVWYSSSRRPVSRCVRQVRNQARPRPTGHDVIRIRYAAVIFGAAMAGIAGSFLSLVYLRTWEDSMTASQRLGRCGGCHFSPDGSHPVIARRSVLASAYIVAFQAQIIGGAFQYVSSSCCRCFPTFSPIHRIGAEQPASRSPRECAIGADLALCARAKTVGSCQ